MSEYQYHDFLAVDRRLGAEDQAELRAISSRARITPTSFSNHYEWGDLKADPRDMLERWFDLYTYMGFWSVRVFMIRLPRHLFDPEAAHPYAGDWIFKAEASGDSVILEFHPEELDIDRDDDGSGWAAALAPLRAQLLEGDLRCLYLGWLFAVQCGGVDEEAEEPPRPPGLSRLDDALEAFADFIDLDADLIAAAAEGDDSVDPLTEEAIDAFIRDLPGAEKDALLLRMVRGEGATITSELRRRCRRSLADSSPAVPVAAPRRAGDLLAAAEVVAKERERREAEREAAELARRLDALAKRGEAAWIEVADLIETKRPSDYDRAVALLRDLKALAEREGTEADFRGRVGELRFRHARKAAFVGRLDDAGLLAVR